MVETRYAFTDSFALPGAWYYRLAQLEDFGLVRGEVGWTPGYYIEVSSESGDWAVSTSYSLLNLPPNLLS